MGTSDDSPQQAKPCPKCGNAPIVVPTMFSDKFYVICRGCTTQTPAAPTKEKAIHLWNDGVYEES